MSYRTTVIGKISNLKEIKWKSGNDDRIGCEFTVGEPTGRKHPEGHPYAGKSVIEWTRCKSFLDAQAAMILKRFKNGDYIALDGELRVESYDRNNVEVEVPRQGMDPLKLKATVRDYPSLEFIIDKVHFVTDAPEGYNNNSPITVTDDALAAEIEAIAAAQAAEQAAAAAAATQGHAQTAAAGTTTPTGTTTTGAPVAVGDTPPF